MARIRSIKPEIRRSLIVSSWPYPVRWTFVGLPGYLDDSGRGHDNTSLIKAELYPLDDDMTARKLEQHLIAISSNGPLCRYEIAGQRYLHITTWDEHQRINRPSPSRIPPCPIHEDSVSHSLNGSRSTHGALTEGSSHSRAPAEQGAGKGAGKGKEQGAGKGSDAAAAASSNGHEKTLLDKHQADFGALPVITAKSLLAHIRAALDEHPDDVILAALEDWRRRPDAKPGLFPHLVGDAARRPTPPDPDDPLAGLDPDARAWVAEQQAARAGAAR